MFDSWNYLYMEASEKELDTFASEYLERSHSLIEYALKNKNMSCNAIRKIHEYMAQRMFAQSTYVALVLNQNTPKDILIDIYNKVNTGKLYDYDARIHGGICGNHNMEASWLHNEAVKFIKKEVKQDSPWTTNLNEIVFNKSVSVETLKMIVLDCEDNMTKLHALFRYFMINENECKHFTHKNICSKKTLSESNELLKQKFEKWKKDFDLVLEFHDLMYLNI